MGSCEDYILLTAHNVLTTSQLIDMFKYVSVFGEEVILFTRCDQLVNEWSVMLTQYNIWRGQK